MRRHRICAIAAAATVAVALGGCSIGQVDLDDYVASLPSVEEARAQRNEGMTPVVSGSALREEGKLVVGIPVAQTVPFSTVSDEGEPIEPEEASRIFKRFYRAERHKQSPGFGLGLAIAESTAKRARGRIRCESADGWNSFIVELPRI